MKTPGYNRGGEFGGLSGGVPMPSRSQVIRYDPAERLDARERVERLRRVDPTLVDAMMGGDATVRDLARVTGRSKSAVHRSIARLREAGR
jgi:uncharacterized membrane protein